MMYWYYRYLVLDEMAWNQIWNEREKSIQVKFKSGDVSEVHIVFEDMNEGGSYLVDTMSSSNFDNAFAAGQQDLVMGEVVKSWEAPEVGDENGLLYLTLIEGTQVGVQLKQGETNLL